MAEDDEFISRATAQALIKDTDRWQQAYAQSQNLIAEFVLIVEEALEWQERPVADQDDAAHFLYWEERAKDLLAKARGESVSEPTEPEDLPK